MRLPHLFSLGYTISRLFDVDPSLMTVQTKMPIIDDRFSNYVRDLAQAWNIKGLSLAVVRPDGELEFGAWGDRTEGEEKVTPEVRNVLDTFSRQFLY